MLPEQVKTLLKNYLLVFSVDPKLVEPAKLTLSKRNNYLVHNYRRQEHTVSPHSKLKETPTLIIDVISNYPTFASAYAKFS